MRTAIVEAKSDRRKRVVRSRWTVGVYVVALVAVVVAVDVLFFRHLFWARLLANIAVVLVFAAFSLKFLKRR